MSTRSIDTSALVFNVGAKTLDFSAYTGFAWRQLVTVINLTRANAVLFALGDTLNALAGTPSGAVGTLTRDLTGMANGDLLSYIYEGGTTATNRSATITGAGASQTLMPANPLRFGGFVQNLSAGDLWINDGGAAAASIPSILLPSGSYYDLTGLGNTTSSISIWGGTAGQSFTSREW